MIQEMKTKCYDTIPSEICANKIRSFEMKKEECFQFSHMWGKP